MTENSSSWTRLSFSPSTGRITVEGDVYTVLGISADDMGRSRDPLAVLPASVARCLIEGDGIVRDRELSIIIVPGDTRYSNSVTIIKEKTPEYDLISDIASGVASFSPDGTILSWNKRMSFLFGPAERDVKGRKADEILPAPVLYNWTSVLSSVHMGHEVKIEFRPSGEKKVEGILSRGGPGVIGLFFDSTENYNTGKRLRALNRLNQAYIQSTETGLILLDSRLRILLSNSGFSRIYGEKGSLIGLQLHDVLPEESYKWVHDASERLLGEERSEQTAMVTFRRGSDEQLAIRHTLRAVRNEMNQAVNFVCLFEDRTEVTSLRFEVENLRKCLTGVTGIADSMDSASEDICERIQEITGSSSVLLYTYNQSETLRLSGSCGSWPAGLKREEPGDLGFPALVWRGDEIYRVTGSELGEASQHFKLCVILPRGRGVSNRGFILLCDPTQTGSDQTVLNLVTALVDLRKETLSRTDSASPDRNLSRGDALLTGVLSNLSFPAAIFSRSGTMEYCNDRMERLSGIETSDFQKEDLSGLIDPLGNGLTLDSLASGGIPEEGEAMVWSARRRDGSSSESCRWHISIFEDPWAFQGDFGFLVTAVPLIKHPECSDTSTPARIPVEMLRSFIGIITLQSEREIFRSVSDMCFQSSSSGAIEFHRNGEAVASFSLGSTSAVNFNWSAGPPLLLNGREYGTRTTSGVNISLLESICEALSSLRGTQLMQPSFSDPSADLAGGIQNLVNYLKRFTQDSVKQTSSVLNLLEPTDTFAGFARTLLYSGESAERAAGLLSAALSVSRENFRIVSLEKFLSRFHSAFLEKGLRLPSLSMDDRLPEVMIIPGTVLQALSMLCQNKSSESIVSFSASSVERGGEVMVELTVTGLSGEFSDESIDEGIKNLADGIIDSAAETAVLLQILSASGCRLDSMDEKGFRLLFTATSIH